MCLRGDVGRVREGKGREGEGGGGAYHPPLPAPFFLVFLGSVSMWPDLAK
jgi:hypothetical protein